MTSPAIDIKDILLSAGVADFATENDWSVYIGRLPEVPNRCIMVTDTGGVSPEPGLAIDYPTFQIVCRGDVGDYVEAYGKIKTIKDLLLGMDPKTINNNNWMGILMRGDIVFLGYDTGVYPMFSANFQAFIEPLDLSNSNRRPL